MNHEEAIRLSAQEKYLLNELPAGLRDEFEEHYFECKECALDVRAGAALVDQMKQELRVTSASKGRVEPVAIRKPAFFSRPMVTIAAMAAMFFVIAYQNVMTYPHLKRELAAANQPAILPAPVLVNGINRGEEEHPVVVNRLMPVLLSIDVPKADLYQTFSLMLSTPGGEVSWKSVITPEQARNGFQIVVPAAAIRVAGSYTLVVRGAASSGEPPVDLARRNLIVKPD